MESWYVFQISIAVCMLGINQTWISFKDWICSLCECKRPKKSYYNCIDSHSIMWHLQSTAKSSLLLWKRDDFFNHLTAWSQDIYTDNAMRHSDLLLWLSWLWVIFLLDSFNIQLLPVLKCPLANRWAELFPRLVCDRRYKSTVHCTRNDYTW